MTYMKAILGSSFLRLSHPLPLPPAAEAAEEDAQGHAWKKIDKKENIDIILCEERDFLVLFGRMNSVQTPATERRRATKGFSFSIEVI